MVDTPDESRWTARYHNLSRAFRKIQFRGMPMILASRHGWTHAEIFVLCRDPSEIIRADSEWNEPGLYGLLTERCMIQPKPLYLRTYLCHSRCFQCSMSPVTEKFKRLTCSTYAHLRNWTIQSLVERLTVKITNSVYSLGLARSDFQDFCNNGPQVDFWRIFLFGMMCKWLSIAYITITTSKPQSATTVLFAVPTLLDSSWHLWLNN